MNKENYVSFEQAKLLKEKGFPQYEQDGIEHWYCNDGEIDTNFIDKPICSCPTIYQVQKWLYDEYDIFVEVCPGVDINDVFIGFHYEIYSNIHSSYIWNTGDICVSRSEEALSKGIDEALKLI